MPAAPLTASATFGPASAPSSSSSAGLATRAESGSTPAALLRHLAERRDRDRVADELAVARPARRSRRARASWSRPRCRRRRRRAGARSPARPGRSRPRPRRRRRGEPRPRRCASGPFPVPHGELRLAACPAPARSSPAASSPRSGRPTTATRTCSRSARTRAGGASSSRACPSGPTTPCSTSPAAPRPSSLELVRQKGCSVVGVDQSPRDARRGAAAARARGRDERVRLVEASAEELPFEDGSFDGLTAAYLLRYLDDLPAGLRELAPRPAAGRDRRAARLRRPAGPGAARRLGSLGRLRPAARRSRDLARAGTRSAASSAAASATSTSAGRCRGC